MEVVLIILVVLLALVAFVWVAGLMFRNQGDAVEAEMKAFAPGADVNRQFRRPPDEGRLL